MVYVEFCLDENDDEYYCSHPVSVRVSNTATMQPQSLLAHLEETQLDAINSHTKVYGGVIVLLIRLIKLHFFSHKIRLDCLIKSSGVLASIYNLKVNQKRKVRT